MATSRLVRRVGRGLLLLVLILGAVVGMLWALQRQLIYYPDATQVPPPAEVLPGSRDVSLNTADGLELGAWFVPAAGREDTGMAVLVATGLANAGFARALSVYGGTGYQVTDMGVTLLEVLRLYDERRQPD